MGGFAARKSRLILDNMAFIIGIELMTSLQSLDLLREHEPSQKLSEIHQKVRKYVPYLEKDEYYGPKVTVAKDLIMNGLNNL
jgi:histidine ammonia-lyase